MKKVLKKIGLILEELTYFVPDIILVLAILSVFFADFGQFDVLIKVCMFAIYLALALAERMYFSVRFVNRNVKKVIDDKFDDLVGKINEKKYASTDKVMLMLEFFEGVYDEKIINLDKKMQTELKKIRGA